jgi:hypothetical protein
MDEVDRIRFVTRRFGELQGLRLILVMILAGAAFWAQPHVGPLRYSGPGWAVAGFVASVLPFAIVLLARPILDRYYRNRFGSVAGGEQRRLEMLPPLVVLVVGIALDARNMGSGAPSATLIAAALIALHIIIRDWPYRGYYLIAAIGCAVAAPLPALVPAMHVDAASDLRIPYTVLFALYAVPALLDHRLLTKVLPTNPEAASTEMQDAEPVRSPGRD